MTILRLEDLEVYQKAMKFGDEIWEIVMKWDFFQRDTIGKQLVRTADSISANIAEGYGRYFYKENKQFCFYSRGSILETKSWIVKSGNRKLISEVQLHRMLLELELIHKMLNGYIKSI